MWIRAAFWLGRPVAGNEREFRDLIDTSLIPAFKQLPGVVQAQALWAHRHEPGAPDIACQFLVHFTRFEEIDAMRRSPERAALDPLIKQVIALFNGAISHIDYEVG